MVIGSRSRAAGRGPDRLGHSRYQRGAVQSAGAVRWLQTIGPRPRAGCLRHRRIHRAQGHPTRSRRSVTMHGTGGDAVVEALRGLGVDTVFGIASVHNLPILDAMRRAGGFRIIDMRHEQSAVHAADGYSRVTGRLGSRHHIYRTGRRERHGRTLRSRVRVLSRADADRPGRNPVLRTRQGISARGGAPAGYAQVGDPGNLVRTPQRGHRRRGDRGRPRSPVRAARTHCSGDPHRSAVRGRRTSCAACASRDSDGAPNTDRHRQRRRTRWKRPPSADLGRRRGEPRRGRRPR